MNVLKLKRKEVIFDSAKVDKIVIEIMELLSKHGIVGYRIMVEMAVVNSIQKQKASIVVEDELE